MCVMARDLILVKVKVKFKVVIVIAIIVAVVIGTREASAVQRVTLIMLSIMHLFQKQTVFDHVNIRRIQRRNLGNGRTVLI